MTSSSSLRCGMRRFWARSPSFTSKVLGDKSLVGRSQLGTRLLLCDPEPQTFSRAAVRWHARYCREVDASLEEAQALLAALAALRSPRREPAARALAELVYRRGFEGASEALMRWANDLSSAQAPTF
jgi:hypothetical protein